MNDITTAFQVLRQELQPVLVDYFTVADAATNRVNRALENHRLQHMLDNQTARQQLLEEMCPADLRTLFFFSQLYEDSTVFRRARHYGELLDHVHARVGTAQRAWIRRHPPADKAMELAQAVKTEQENLLCALTTYCNAPLGNHATENWFFCVFHHRAMGTSYPELTSYDLLQVDSTLRGLLQLTQYHLLVPKVLLRPLHKALSGVVAAPQVRTPEDALQWFKILTFGTLLIQYYYDVRHTKYSPYINGLLHDLLPEPETA